ncbi:MAG: outer membrane protein assembly factor BamD, partial [bacterium]|nr:outer membrane protein assembly factor BamD [bacterium]
GGKKAMVKKMEADDLYARGQQFFQNKKYVDAMDDFKAVVFNYSGSKLALDANYFLAECYLRTRDYPGAVAEFQQILNSFSPCRYDDEARFKIALCYYKDSPNYALDQSETTVKAGQALNLYFTYLADTTWAPEARQLKVSIEDKLAHKDFDAGRIYFKMKRYAPAKLYLENLMTQYPQTHWAQEAKKLLEQIPVTVKAQPAVPETIPAATDSSQGK